MTQEDFKKKWTLQEFKNRIWQAVEMKTDVYPLWMLAEFCEKWARTYGSAKMRWQLKRFNKEQTFKIINRLATWKSLSMEWHPKRWDVKKAMAPVKWLPTNNSPEALEEMRLIKEATEKAKIKARTPYKPKTVTRMKLDEVRKAEELKKQSENDFTNFKELKK